MANTSNNQLRNYLVELFQRLKTTKPKFFSILQKLAALLAALTGLPDLLLQWGIVLPPAATILENKAVAFISIGALIASQLTSASPVEAVTADGAVLKKTDEKSLPFTAEAEVKKAQVDLVPNTSTTLAEVKL